MTPAPRRTISRAGTLARGLGALLLLGGLLVGWPALLVGVVGVPTSLPPAAELLRRLTTPDDGTVFVAAAAAVGWAAWAVFALSTLLLEGIELARHGLSRRTARPGRHPFIPLAAPRRLAAELLTAVVLLVDAGHLSLDPWTG